MRYVCSRILLIIMFIMCLSAKAEQTTLFNQDCPQYKRWQQAKASMDRANKKLELRQKIASAAKYVGVPINILLAVCFVESSHRELSSIPDGTSVSYGVCQVKLGTAQYMDRVYNLVPVTAEDLLDAWTNAYYAAKYLRHQYKRYGSWNRAIDAYNKGKLVSENSVYVNKVILAMESVK